MNTTKPVFILVHGGWHKPLHYQPFVDAIEKRRYKIVAPSLPSITEESPHDTPEADIEFLANIARKLSDEGNEVVLIGHSCGSIAASEAAHGLGLRERSGKGLPGGVRSVIAVAGMVRAAGQALAWGLEEQEKPLAIVEGNALVLNPDADYAHMLYSDVPREKWDGLLAQLTKHPLACGMHVMKNPAWDEVERGYLYCEEDAAMTPARQRRLVNEMQGMGITFKEASIPSGHFPFLSMPEVLVDKILEIS